jgi:SH3-like domain-containing protein
VECVEEEAGWLLVRTPDGEQGWIPAASIRGAPRD